MKAVLHTGGDVAWADVLGRPWPLLPVGNRPWIEYWIEWCVEQGIRSLQIVLGEGAWEVEQCLGGGERWGVTIGYSFLREGADPRSYLARDPTRWREGLFFLGAPLFPRRTADYTPGAGPPATCSGPGYFLSADPAAIEAFIRSGAAPDALQFPASAIQPVPLASLRDYYQLNMELVRGGIGRYLAPGYSARDGAYLGLNVIYPPSALLTPPLIIGDHVRLRGLCTVGPDAVLGHRIIVDRQAEVRSSVVLDGTYLGAGIEVVGRIVAGRRLIDPEDGTALDIEDLHLLAPLREGGAGGDGARDLLHRLLALAGLAVGFLPWLLGVVLGTLAGGRYAAVRRVGRRGPLRLWEWRRHGRWCGCLARLSLDVWPNLWRVLRGDLWLAGQLPEEEGTPGGYPAVFSRADARADRDDPVLREIENRYYAHHRSLGEDLRVLARAWAGRLAGCPWAGVGETSP